jgi:hypothetical protein
MADSEHHVYIDKDTIRRLPFYVDTSYWIHQVQPAILKTGEFKTTDDAETVAKLVLLADALNYNSTMKYVGDGTSSVVITKKTYLYGED